MQITQVNAKWSPHNKYGITYLERDDEVFGEVYWHRTLKQFIGVVFVDDSHRSQRFDSFVDARHWVEANAEDGNE